MARLPKLDRNAAIVATLRLQTLKGVDEQTRQVIAGLIAAAAAESELEFSVNALPYSRRQNMVQTAADIDNRFNAVATRGRLGLMSITDDEWQALLDSENSGVE